MNARLYCAALAVLLASFFPPSVAPQRPSGVAPSARLYCGTDNSGFSGMNGQLAIVPTNGPTPGKVEIFDLSYPLNGITAVPGYLLTGQPENVGAAAGNLLRRLSLTRPPVLLLTISPGINSFSASCCNEQMAPVGDGTFFHVHYGDSIQQISTIVYLTKEGPTIQTSKS
jgi:hypothetical protein